MDEALFVILIFAIFVWWFEIVITFVKLLFALLLMMIILLYFCDFIRENKIKSEAYASIRLASPRQNALNSPHAF